LNLLDENQLNINRPSVGATLKGLGSNFLVPIPDVGTGLND